MTGNQPYSCHAWAYHHKWYGLPKRGQLELTATGMRFVKDKDSSFLFDVPHGEELVAFYPLSTSFRLLHKSQSWNISFGPPGELWQNYEEQVHAARRGTVGELVDASTAYRAFKKAAEEYHLRSVGHAEWKAEKSRRTSAAQPVHH